MKVILALDKKNKNAMPFVWLVKDEFKLDTVNRLLPDPVDERFRVVEITNAHVNVANDEGVVLKDLRNEAKATAK